MSPIYEEQLPQAMAYQQPQSLPAPGQGASVQIPSSGTQTVQETEIDIKSPMIGTFYRAPSPESAPYVEIGTEVHPETIVCIIEAMKVMNEIKAEVHGISQSIGGKRKTVEYGQPLFKVKPL
jgi:acetyl-CoA carboxylase biotin carboxyl carrier protein